MDQSPIMLEISSCTTYEKKGSVTVGVSQKKSGDKRYATLTICVRLDGTPQCPVPQPFISIIFKGTGKRISESERNAYAKDVHVQFQKNAWTDSTTLADWSDEFCKWLQHNADSKRKILFLDNLKAQSSEEFRERLANKNVLTWFLPPNTTDMVQPVDRHLAQQLKVKVAGLLEDKLIMDETFRKRWMGLDDGTFSASDCRILFTHLISQAWREICRERNFLELGWHTGCVMVKKGVVRSEHDIDNITITGTSHEYSFEHVVLDSDVEEPTGDTTMDQVTTFSDQIEAFEPLAVGEPDRQRRKQSEVTMASKESSNSNDTPDDDLASMDSYDDDNSDSEEENDIVRINVAEEGINDDDEIMLDADLVQDDAIDDTSEYQAKNMPSAPAGFEILEKPPKMPAVSSIINHKVLWYIPLRADGTEGWIIAQVRGGPPDPVSAASGNTVRLSCQKAFDINTPVFLSSGKVHHPAAFTIENYGARWVLLREV